MKCNVDAAQAWDEIGTRFRSLISLRRDCRDSQNIAVETRNEIRDVRSIIEHPSMVQGFKRKLSVEAPCVSMKNRSNKGKKR